MKCRPSFIVVLAVVLVIAIWTGKPIVKESKTGMSPRLSIGTYYGIITGYSENKFSVSVRLQGHGAVRIRINGATADDVMVAVRESRVNQQVCIKVDVDGELTEWMPIKRLPGIRVNVNCR